MLLSPQTKKVYDIMKTGAWISQVECADKRITLRLSNKIRELEKKGFIVDREPVAAGRKDLRYRFKEIPPEPRIEIINGKAIMFVPKPIT